MENLDKLINAIVEGIDDKKGQGIVSLDLTGFDGAICSHFVVCNADSTTQVDAISQSIEDKVFEVMGEWPVRVEGRQNSFWIAMDYSDVIVHIFQSELRDFYRLEELWADAPMKRYDFGE
jgi:ribosome-associated protein